MHEYDVALKRILTRPGSLLIQQLTGSTSIRWLNVETPRVRNPRVDLLGETPSGGLVQIEFQSRNERHFPFRMGEYLFLIGLRYGRLPRQAVLYVGNDPPRMEDRIEGPDYSFRFHLVDARDLDGEQLLASENLGDNIIAILTRLGSQPEMIRRILERIGKGAPEARELALTEMLLLAGLRKATGEVEREARKMPIHYDIMDHELFGPKIRKGILDGKAELLLGMIEKRYGPISTATRERIAAMNEKQIAAASLRILDATRLQDVLQ